MSCSRIASTLCALALTSASAIAQQPATRKPDYSPPAKAPYTAEDVTITTPAGHTLAGTLTLPKGASRERPVAAIVTITGSGPQERDEPLGELLPGFRMFRQVADTLGRRGIAVLRMDDRGTGASTGNYRTATSADFADDIRAGLAYLRTRPEIAANRLGLVGHSEGGLIGPLVASKEPDLRALVMLAGPAQSGRTILKFQLTNQVNQNTTLTGARRDSALARIDPTIDSLGANNPWMKFFFDYDPLATIRQLKVPVLILNGGNDQQVTPEQVQTLVETFKAAGNRDVTSHVFPNVNHLFIYDPDGSPWAYTRLTRSAVEPEVLGMVADWLVKHLNQ